MASPERRQPHTYTLEEVASMAKEATLVHGGHIPAIIVESGSRTVVGHLANLPGTHEGRLKAMFAAGSALAESREMAVIQQMFFISEGWMSHRAKDQGEITVPPSQDPQRKEVLIVTGSAESKGWRASLVMFEMLRNEDGELVELAQLQSAEDEDLRVASPLLNAFLEGFRREMRGKLN